MTPIWSAEIDSNNCIVRLHTEKGLDDTEPFRISANTVGMIFVVLAICAYWAWGK